MLLLRRSVSFACTTTHVCYFNPVMTLSAVWSVTVNLKKGILNNVQGAIKILPRPWLWSFEDCGETWSISIRIFVSKSLTQMICCKKSLYWYCNRQFRITWSCCLPQKRLYTAQFTCSNCSGWINVTGISSWFKDFTSNLEVPDLLVKVLSHFKIRMLSHCAWHVRMATLLSIWKQRSTVK